MVLSSPDEEELRWAKAVKVPLLLVWLAMWLGLLIFIPAYWFEQNYGLLDKLVTAVVYAVIVAAISYLLLTTSLLLFARRPLIEIEDGLIRFPLLRMTISANDITGVKLQGTEVLQQCRIAIELKEPQQRHYLTWLLLPTVYTFRGKVYLVPLYIAAPPGAVRAAVIAALTPSG